MIKNNVFILIIFFIYVHSPCGALPTSRKQVESGNTRLLDERRGYLDDIPERNVDDDGGFIADDDGVATDDTPITDDTQPTDDIAITDDTPVTDDTPTNPCTQNTDGSFGNTSSTGIQVTYNFEMVTVANAEIESTLSALEDDISSTIARSGLVSCTSRRNLRRKLDVTGLSSAPQDKVLEEECALVDDVGADKCNVIEGRLTVYVDGNSDQVTKDVKSLLKNGMEDGSFASSSDDIIQLIYFEADDEIQPVPENIQNKAKGGVNATPFIASGACALALIGFITGQRMLTKDKQNEEADETEEPEVSEKAEENTSFFSKIFRS